MKITETKIRKIIAHTDTVHTFRLECEDVSEIKPCHYFYVSLPEGEEVPASVSGIGADTVDFTFEKQDEASEKIFDCSVGDHLVIRGPFGYGINAENYVGENVVVITEGIGISPAKTLTDVLADHPDHAGHVTLVAGFRDPDSVIFPKHFKSWEEKIHTIKIFHEAAPDQDVRIGNVLDYLKSDECPITDDTIFFLAGPLEMLQEASAILKGKGVKQYKIRVCYEARQYSSPDEIYHFIF